MNRIAIDIETYPTDDAKQYFDESEVKIGNLKDPEKIKAKIDEACENYLTRAALNWYSARVTCIAMYDGNETEYLLDKNEKYMLEYLFDYLKKRKTAGILTWNGYDFDCQFLLMRAAINDVPCKDIRGKKYYTPGAYHLDLMQALTSCGKYVSLSKASKAMLGMDKIGSGADAITLWASDQYDELAEYCKKDAELLYQIWKKVNTIYY